MEFVKTSAYWIEGRDIMDTCFTLNYGYEAPLPWPQVLSHDMCIQRISIDLITFDIKQVRMRLADEDSDKGLQLDLGSHGMNIPSACTIVIIAGSRLTHTQKRIVKVTFSTPGEYTSEVDRVMTQVERITEDIAHMPVAAFIFRDKESDEVHYSTDIRYVS